MEDYYENPSLSHSRLKEIRKSPGHFKYAMDNPSPSTDAMNLGSLVHAMVLEPHTVEGAFLQLPKIDRRTKEGKQQYADFQSESMGKCCVSPADWKTAELMTESVMAHPVASLVLDDAIAHGQVEREYFWDDSRFGDKIERKAKVDGLCLDDHFGMKSPLVDLKTTLDSSPHAFKRSVTKFSYATQMSYYREAVATSGVHSSGALIIAVEKKPPYATGVYRLLPETIDRADAVVRKWLKTYADCMSSGLWPSYWDLEEVEVPDWFMKENGVNE
jgi:exodeoxyribonuclease VIII